jgi:hypothetical protein
MLYILNTFTYILKLRYTYEWITWKIDLLDFVLNFYSYLIMFDLLFIC